MSVGERSGNGGTGGGDGDCEGPIPHGGKSKFSFASPGLLKEESEIGYSETWLGLCATTGWVISACVCVDDWGN